MGEVQAQILVFNIVRITSAKHLVYINVEIKNLFTLRGWGGCVQATRVMDSSLPSWISASR